MAGPVTNNAVVITNGLFTVLIDFGSGAFTGRPTGCRSAWKAMAAAVSPP